MDAIIPAITLPAEEVATPARMEAGNGTGEAFMKELLSTLRDSAGTDAATMLPSVASSQITETAKAEEDSAGEETISVDDGESTVIDGEIRDASMASFLLADILALLSKAERPSNATQGNSAELEGTGIDMSFPAKSADVLSRGIDETAGETIPGALIGKDAADPVQETEDVVLPKTSGLAAKAEESELFIRKATQNKSTESAEMKNAQEEIHTANFAPAAKPAGEAEQSAIETISLRRTKESGGGNTGSTYEKGERLEGISLATEGMPAPDGIKTVGRKVETPEITSISREMPQASTNDGVSLEFSLEPEGMGKLDIRLNAENGIIHARIDASESAGREIIDRNLNSILETLAAEGITVGSFSVNLKGKQKDSFDGRGRRAVSAAAETATNERDPHEGRIISIFI